MTPLQAVCVGIALLANTLHLVLTNRRVSSLRKTVILQGEIILGMHPTTFRPRPRPLSDEVIDL